jgi:outer membrane immunogenic protein
LFYGTGGLVIADEKFSASATPGVTNSDSKLQTGWVAGVGVEWMFMPHWSFKAEYLYRSITSATLLGLQTNTLNMNSGQAGINFHF